MTRIVYSPTARRDVLRVVEYIARDDPAVARALRGGLNIIVRCLRGLLKWDESDQMSARAFGLLSKEAI